MPRDAPDSSRCVSFAAYCVSRNCPLQLGVLGAAATLNMPRDAPRMRCPCCPRWRLSNKCMCLPQLGVLGAAAALCMPRDGPDSACRLPWYPLLRDAACWLVVVLVLGGMASDGEIHWWVPLVCPTQALVE